MELANTTSSVKGSTKRGIIVQARTASPSIWEAFTLFMNDDARCGSKPARWRCRVFFTKEWMLHEIPDEPARRGSHTSASYQYVRAGSNWARAHSLHKGWHKFCKKRWRVHQLGQGPTHKDWDPILLNPLVMLRLLR